MNRYQVWIAANADKELDSLTVVLRQRIIDKFDEIRKDPRGTDSKKLDDHIYRIRAGDYRIAYEVRDAEKMVVVTKIRHRRDVYRG